MTGPTSAWTRSQDGLDLHALVHGEAGGGLPAICLPGLTRNAAEFSLLADALLATGPARRIVAVDYRGRGRSDHDPDASHYAIPVETADLLAMLTHLGIRRATLIGVSRGGLIAMGLAAKRPDLVAGLVLSDIGPVVEREGLLRIKGYIGRLGEPQNLDEAAALLRGRFGPHFPALSEQDWHDWAGTVWVPRDGRLAAAYDPALAGTMDGVDETSPIPDLWKAFDAMPDIPILAIRGGLSDLLSAATVAEMVRRRPGLGTIEVEGEGHTPLLHRPAIVARIAALLAEADSRAVVNS